MIKTILATASTLASALHSKFLLRCICVLSLAFLCQPGRADTVYQTQESFLKDTFTEDIKPSVLWLDKSIQDDITKILGHSYPQARLRYWRKDNTSVWVLEEIGKEYPITAGFVISDNKIARTQVLTYRETRGMEIHLPGFLAQFAGSQLNDDKLSKKIDGIAGATMSVNAMVKMAQVALLLNKKAQ